MRSQGHQPLERTSRPSLEPSQAAKAWHVETLHPVAECKPGPGVVEFRQDCDNATLFDTRVSGHRCRLLEYRSDIDGRPARPAGIVQVTVTITIRNAEPGDAATILHFIRELAEYEREPDAVVATEAMIRASLFDEGALTHGLICERGGRPVGFAVYFFNYSTWLGRNGLYLEDLYVSPAERGNGAGKALLIHMAQIAVSRGCGRFEWSVLDWNEPAIQFYRALGAEPLDEWTVYRVTGDALHRLASSGQ